MEKNNRKQQPSAISRVNRKNLDSINAQLRDQPQSGKLHLLLAEIYIKISDQSTDLDGRETYLNYAIQSARKSVQCSPNDLETHLYLANLLLEVAQDAKGRQLVFQACDEALAVECSNESDVWFIEAIKKVRKNCHVRCENMTQAYWKTLRVGARKKFFTVCVHDLEAHFTSLGNELANDAIREALDFGNAHGSWRFWMCFCGDERFASSDALYQHLADTHMNTLSPQVKSMVCNGSWRPEKSVPSSSENKIPDKDDGTITVESLIKESISFDGVSLTLFLKPQGPDPSVTSFPGCQNDSEDVPVVGETDEKLLNLWMSLLEDRKLQGTAMYEVLKDMSEAQPMEVADEEAAINAATSHSDSSLSEEGQASKQKIPSPADNFMKDMSEAQPMEVDEEEAVINAATSLFDLSLSEVQASKQKILSPADNIMKDAIKRLCVDIELEIWLYGVWTMHTRMDPEKFELRLNPFAAYDYRGILCPLVKSYLRKRLEDLADADAAKKLEAQRKLLSELLDDNQMSNGRGTQSNQSQENIMSKKKKKKSKSKAESKTSDANEKLPSNLETREMVYGVSTEEPAEMVNKGTSGSGHLNQTDEGEKWEGSREYYEHLEYQRMFGDDAVGDEHSGWTEVKTRRTRR